MSTLQIYRNVLLAGASAALLVSVGACSRDNGFSAGAGSGGGVASTAGSGSTTTASGDTGAAAGADGTGAGASGSGSSQVASNGTGSGASGSTTGSGSVGSGTTGSGSAGSGSAGSGTTGSGTTGSGSGTGSGTGSGSGSGSTSSDGTVARVANAATGTTGGALVTTGNALLGATGGAVGAPVSALGASLQSNGLAAVPVAGSTLASTAKTADGLVNPNAKVVVLNNTPLVGSSAAGSQQLYGVSALSPAVAGQNATVGVLNNGVPSASTTTGLVRADTVQNISVGQNGSNLVGASVLSPASPQGSVATVNVHPSTLSQPVSVAGVGNPTGAVSALTGATAAVPATATSLVGR